MPQSFMYYTNLGITCELNRVRKCIINSFYKTIPHSRILVSLSIIVDVILKINNNDIENIIENIHDLRENILYMLSFEKLVRDEQQSLIDDEYKDIHKDQSGNEDGDKYKYTLPIFGLNSCK